MHFGHLNKPNKEKKAMEKEFDGRIANHDSGGHAGCESIPREGRDQGEERTDRDQ